MERKYKSSTAYSGFHKPTKETWHILKIDEEKSLVYVAGWPPTVAYLSDMENIEERRPLEQDEIDHLRNRFKVES
jgi:hypothetical protein